MVFFLVVFFLVVFFLVVFFLVVFFLTFFFFAMIKALSSVDLEFPASLENIREGGFCARSLWVGEIENFLKCDADFRDIALDV